MKLRPLIVTTFILCGCASTSQVDETLRVADVPQQWTFNKTEPVIIDNWLTILNQPALEQLVSEATLNNQTLRQSAYDLEITAQQLIQADADFWPTLDLTTSTGRSKSISDGTSSISNSSSLELEAGYEVDIWGKLSAAQQQANLTYLATQAQYEQEQQALVAQVTTAWFDLITATQLYQLSLDIVENTQQNLEIIESGYRQGLNSALDVYLSRNELNSEISNSAQQHDEMLQAARALERILGRYPSAKIIEKVAQTTLPLLDNDIPLGLPSDIITRKPELIASWYQVLAQDAALAYAHKQRFPSINLTASVSDSADELSDLLSGSSLAWSLLGNLTAPLFRAGDLKANEEIERLQLKQQEQAYLDTLYSAFVDVENAISSEKSLKQQYAATVAAQQNAQAAETLSFEQYQKGLVTYTTVLEAQGRSFDAQSALIQLKNQLLANRVDLYIALGGSFAGTNTAQQEAAIPSASQTTVNQQDPVENE